MRKFASVKIFEFKFKFSQRPRNGRIDYFANENNLGWVVIAARAHSLLYIHTSYIRSSMYMCDMYTYIYICDWRARACFLTRACCQSMMVSQGVVEALLALCSQVCHVRCIHKSTSTSNTMTVSKYVCMYVCMYGTYLWWLVFREKRHDHVHVMCASNTLASFSLLAYAYVSNIQPVCWLRVLNAFGRHLLCVHEYRIWMCIHTHTHEILS